jgi:hypothetical protein
MMTGKSTQIELTHLVAKDAKRGQFVVLIPFEAGTVLMRPWMATGEASAQVNYSVQPTDIYALST